MHMPDYSPLASHAFTSQTDKWKLSICLIQSWISAFFLLWASIIEFIVDYWYQITDIHDLIMDIDNSIMGYL